MSLVKRPLIFTFFLLLVLVAGRQLQSPDLGWHIRAGERIVKERAIPEKDDFTHTVAGNHWWVNQPLAEILFYGIHEKMGAPWLIVLRVLIVGSIFLALLKRSGLGGDRNEFLTAGILLLALLAAASHMLVRPFLISALFLALTALIVDRYRTTRAGPLWILPPLFALWAQVHPGFLYGAAVLGCAVAGEWGRRRFPLIRGDLEPLDPGEWRRFLVWSAAAVAAAMLSGAILNPSGLSAILLPIGLMKTGYFFQTLNEFQPASIVRDRFFAILFLLSVVSVLPRRRRDGTELLLLALFGLFAFRAVRVILPFAVVAAPMAIRNLAPFVDRWIVDRTKWGRGLRALGAVGLASVILWWWGADPYRVPAPREEHGWGDTWPWAGVNYPIHAFRFIEQNKLPGEIFHIDRYGGPLILHFYPERKNFIDGRVEVFGEEFFRDTYMRIVARGPGWDDLLDRYRVNTLLLVIGTPARSSPISAVLPSLSQWALVYLDDYAMIYVRRDSLPAENLRRLELVGIHPVEGPVPASYEEEILAGSGLDRMIGNTGSRRSWLFHTVLRTMREDWEEVANLPDKPLLRGRSFLRHALYRLRGEARFRLGDWRGAKEDWKRAGGMPEAENNLTLISFLKKGDAGGLAPAGPDRAGEIARLARLLGDAGDHRRAVELSREALRIGGGRADLRNGLAWVLMEAGVKSDEALREAKQASRERPQDGNIRGTLARAALETGDREGAVRELRESIRLLPPSDYVTGAAERARLALLLSDGEAITPGAEPVRLALEALRLDWETEERPSLTRVILEGGAAGDLALLTLDLEKVYARLHGMSTLNLGRYLFMEALGEAGLEAKEIVRLGDLYTPRFRTKEEPAR